MKLRTKGNSIRLRILQGELARLVAGETLEERITFPADQGSFVYSLATGKVPGDVDVSLADRAMMVRLSGQALARWAKVETVGIYGEVETPAGPLAIALEKDFACLDGNDAENADTFRHPNEATVTC